MHRIFIIVAGGIDHRYLHRINRDDLQIDPALIALDRFAFFYFVGIHVNRVIAFGTYNSHFFRTSNMIRVRPPTYSNLFPYRMMNTAFADTLLII
jgi:hypothetical protein